MLPGAMEVPLQAFGFDTEERQFFVARWLNREKPRLKQAGIAPGGALIEQPKPRDLVVVFWGQPD
jgi:hypothetical protein